jgi:Fe-S-cluster-containing dehydrogenase component/formate-dependent nitrite reductase membrane component NrfD
VQYGFAIDQRTCIGCHACTVACKTENRVPVGQFRTWVKYVDTGEYPSTTREFGVLRCNHCTDAPCVAICPTQALFKREDGIVDFAAASCVGCKACLQACPYDAIYLDEDTHTAAKCNFCAHRVDQGLEPACVVVCPTESIWVGDLDDPASAISRFVATQPTTVRAPEQNTGPNVHYVGADRTVLDPLAAPVDDTYIWAQPDTLRLAVRRDLPADPSGARTTLNTAHPRPWGWKVTAYLWTKAFGAGALMVALVALHLDVLSGYLWRLAAPGVALVGVAATGVLLVADLKRPDRFHYILLRPNPRSWLFRGAVILAAYAALATLWLVGGVLHRHALVTWVSGPAAVVGLLTASYTGYLFGQAEGRDLWQSPLLFWHLAVQAVMVGSGALYLLTPFLNTHEGGRELLAKAMVTATVVHLAMVLVEHTGRHPTRGAQVAARMITHGRYARTFWVGVVGGGVLVVGLGLAGWDGHGQVPTFVAAVLAQASLLAYESVFVRAGQDVPLS